jgi:O-antigen ligase
VRTWSRAAVSWAVILIIADVLHISAITGVTPREGNRVPFTFGDPNFAALYWGASIFVVYASQTPRRRSTRIAAYVALAVAMGLGESNGSLLQLGGGIALLVLLATTRRYGGPAALALAITLGGTAAVVYHEMPPKKIAAWALRTNTPILVNSLGRIGGSTGQRGALIHETTQLYLEHGVAGVGPSVTKGQLAQENFPYPNEVHNDVLAMVVERGPLGLAAWLLLLGCTGGYAVALLRRPLREPAAAALPHPAGLVAATLAFAVAGFYEEVQHQRYLWAMWALLAVAAAQTVKAPVRHYAGLQRPVITRGPFARRGWVV